MLNRKALRKPHRNRNEAIFIFMVLAPVLVQYTLTSVAPMIISLVVTFTNYSLIGSWKWIGLENWKKLFSDTVVWQSLLVTVKYALLLVIPTIIIGLGMALLINKPRKGRNIFKSTWFFPVITSTIVIASIWKWMFTADDTGIVNQILAVFGIQPQFFFGTKLALATVAFLGIYQSVGTAMVYFYAGLKGISQDLYEAAKVDGCTGIQSFKSITLPLLRPTLTYVMITLTSAALKVFDSIYTLYNQTGGPQNCANSLVMHIYKTSFFNMQMGYGSTIAFVLFFLILIISLIQFKVTNKDYE